MLQNKRIVEIDRIWQEKHGHVGDKVIQSCHFTFLVNYPRGETYCDLSFPSPRMHTFVALVLVKNVQHIVKQSKDYTK